MANCGQNELLEGLQEAQDKMAELLKDGKGALAELKAKIAEAQEQLSNIALPSIPIKESLQEALAKLKSAIGPERAALEAELREKFGDAVDNLEDLMSAMRNPIDELQFQEDLLKAQEQLTQLLNSGTVGKLLDDARAKLAELQAGNISICDDVPNFQFDPATGEALKEAAESLVPTLEPIAEDLAAELETFVTDSQIEERLREVIETGIPVSIPRSVPSTRVTPSNRSVPENLQSLPDAVADLPQPADPVNDVGNTGSLTAGTGFSVEQLSSSGPAFPHRIRSQRVGGVLYTEDVIRANLRLLNDRVLKYIQGQYPNVIITSGFRPSNDTSTSQHCKGQAADMQFPGTSRDQYDEIAQWIRDNLTYDQLILEYQTGGSGNPWIHISYNANHANGYGRLMVMTFMNHSRTNNGLRDLSSVV
jgi:hypothetical protein